MSRRIKKVKLFLQTAGWDNGEYIVASCLDNTVKMFDTLTEAELYIEEEVPKVEQENWSIYKKLTPTHPLLAGRINNGKG